MIGFQAVLGLPAVLSFRLGEGGGSMKPQLASTLLPGPVPGLPYP